MLTQSGIDYDLTAEEAPRGSKRRCDKDNNTCHGLRLHYITNSIYHIYSNMQSAMKMWEALMSKYDFDDTGIKNACSRLLSSTMIDDKTILEQVHEYENLCAKILPEAMNICDIFQPNWLLDKLSPSWSNYVNTTKHKEKDFKLEELIIHIKIEEQSRIQSKGKNSDHFSSGANLVESKNGSRIDRIKGEKGKGPNQFHRKRHNNKSRDKDPIGRISKASAMHAVSMDILAKIVMKGLDLCITNPRRTK